MAYSFLDAYSSVQSADSSVVSGTVQRPIVNIGSVLVAIPAQLTGNVSVSGTVGASIIGNVNTTITSIATANGAIPVTFSAAANQSVSGTVGASIIGLTPVAVTNIPSISGTVNIAGNPSISGTVNIAGNPSISGTVNVGNLPVTQNVSGSVVATQGTTPWLIGSVYGNISGSVVAFISGTVPTNTAGSVVSFQGTNPWVIGSIVGTYAEDVASADGDRGVLSINVRNDAVASLVGTNLDYTATAVDSAGRTLMRPFAPEESRIEGYITLTSASVTTLVAAAGTGLRNYITDVWVANTGAATTLVTFKDGAGSILGFTIAPTGGGSNLVGLATPMRTGANATFDVQPATQTSTFYATVKGFKAP